MLNNFIMDTKTYGYLSNGEWKESASNSVIQVISPIDGTHVGSIQNMTVQEVDTVIKNAKSAFFKWKELPMDLRVQILKKASIIMRNNVDILTNLIMREVGKNYKESYDEVSRTADLIDFYAEEGRRIIGESIKSDIYPNYGKDKIAITDRVPIGLIVSIPPFNYPINESTPKIVGAIISGNTTVLKAPSQGGISTIALGEIFRIAGLPAGVFNIVSGESSVIGDFLVTHEEIDGINFTGATSTALHIQEVLKSRKKLMPIMLLGLGGKDASIVLEDAPIDKTATKIAQGAFSFSGQRCTAIKRVIVIESIADSLIQKIREEVSKYKIGNPMDQTVDIGPVINDRSADYIYSLFEDAKNKGATVVLGGGRNGRYIDPIILDNVSLEMKIAWEEPFGPILPILRVKNIDEAIEIANNSEYGLQGGIFTQDINKAFYIASKLNVGTVNINGKDSRGPDNLPFTGVKNSGDGKTIQGAKYLIESLTRIKTTVINFD